MKTNLITKSYKYLNRFTIQFFYTNKWILYTIFKYVLIIDNI